MAYPPTTLAGALVATLLFGAVALALLFLGYKLFDWATPRLDLEGELMKNNIAVAIVLGAMILALAWVITAAMA